MIEHFLQPVLETERVRLQPLKSEDFEKLFAVASDPEVWKQHPNPERYQKQVFSKFFEGAMASGGAFIITDLASGDVAGSSRYYSYDEDEESIFIGYTFYGTKFWGSGLNSVVKKLMLDYIFQYVKLVKFHVGKENFRSRKAMEKLGAVAFREVTVAYHGEPDRENIEYRISRESWRKR